MSPEKPSRSPIEARRALPQPEIPPLALRRRASVTLTILLVATLSTTLGCVSEGRRSGPRTRGVGDPLLPFIVASVETGERYCQICAFGGRPTLMTVVDASDPDLERDLAAIQALIDKNRSRSLAAFALVGPMRQGKLGTLDQDPTAITRLRELKQRLGLSFPLVVLPSRMSEAEARDYAPFDQTYVIEGSRSLFLTTPANRVVFADRWVAARADDQRRALESAIESAL